MTKSSIILPIFLDTRHPIFWEIEFFDCLHFCNPIENIWEGLQLSPSEYIMVWYELAYTLYISDPIEIPGSVQDSV